MPTILVVDDEQMICEVLEAYLKREGYIVFTANSGLEALKKIKSLKIDFMILDLMLPDITGEEICRLVRKESDIPIMMLTAKADEENRINGIVIGADDYVIKPFSPREVVVRVQSILKRVMKNSQERLEFNNKRLVIDFLGKEVFHNGTQVSLTPIEFKLLTNMAKYPGRVFSRLNLLEHIQDDAGYYEGYERSIDVHIKNLRKKIEDNSREPKYILTVFGMGYKFGGIRDVQNTTS